MGQQDPRHVHTRQAAKPPRLGLICSLRYQAEWREGLAKKYPDDDPNAIAAAILQRLADDANGMKIDNSLFANYESLIADENFADLISSVEDEHILSVGCGYTPETFRKFLSDLVEALESARDLEAA